MTMTKHTIAFQGNAGAYSDLACRAVYPDYETIPCETFQVAFEAVQNRQAEFAMIPIDNTLAGRVADVHHLIPESGLSIVGEHFQPIQHSLMGIPGTKREIIKHVHSHIHALPQCRKIIADLKAKPHVESDTAGAALRVKEMNSREHAAIASSLAAEIYGLEIIEKDVQDADHNTTRFLIFTKSNDTPKYKKNKFYITSFIFRVQSIPAALYKTLGGFATNGVNMLKLESYIDSQFNAAQFYADVEGHIEEEHVKRAIEELNFFASSYTYLGTYEGHEFRKK
ncbi:MAG: prephenate dehydratase [Pseudomonadota bacterium]